MTDQKTESNTTNGQMVRCSELVMLVCFALFKGMQVKVPKKNGKGYLKVPCGHHSEPWMYEVGGYDVDGLDGMINVDCGYIERAEQGTVAKKLMPAIEERFGFGWKLVDARVFWEA